MSKLTVVPFAGDKESCRCWDDFVRGCINANFLHTRKFLSFCGARFADCSTLVTNESGSILGALPAAASTPPHTVCTHPGATYGGLVHQGGLGGAKAYEATQLLAQHYHSAGYGTLLYKAVPHIYQSIPAQDDLSALFRLGARLVRRDLAVAVSPLSPGKVSSRRRRGLRKAQHAGIAVVSGSAHADCAPKLWRIIEQNLADRHCIAPTHTWSEIAELSRRFPDEIIFVLGEAGGVPLGGVVAWFYPTVLHSQYIGTNEQGRRSCVLDAVFEHLIAFAKEKGLWFSFGISTEEQGQELNAGLHSFKAEFGGGGVVHDFLELTL